MYTAVFTTTGEVFTVQLPELDQIPYRCPGCHGGICVGCPALDLDKEAQDILKRGHVRVQVEHFYKSLGLDVEGVRFDFEYGE